MADREGDFTRLADPFRRELLAHCYGILGSVDEAEDLVQETYLRAWRSYEQFEGRSSIRTWLYRIATNACLTAVEQRNRRPMPTGLGGPCEDPERLPPAQPEIPWLQPLPDALLRPEYVDPAAIVHSRQTVRLAMAAALQHLPPRQRAVLLLRDVFEWRANEVAELLNTTTAAVNSMLQRARAQLGEVSADDDYTEPARRDQRELLDRWAAAMETADVAALMRLLEEDAVWEMPPFAAWFSGRAAIGRLIASQCPAGPGDTLMVPTRANGQPAFAFYLRQDARVHRAYSMHVLSLKGGYVHRVSVFFSPELFGSFGLPMEYAAAG
ncbi:RNA polymerase sigma factor [Acrocarpospora corrugata]|uniref:RNA polymerase sigma factor n=1 Tax=Acrocarpospora corrugata TaxID=35763 RepID=A0A5M3VSF5_9ACTN|nr:sigma-70 family RNA polymerase sigma factor [Acrocarpospora corrugata]GER97982.1 RNA polymerase sigma factor [Acrocarpospora corrugata]